MEAPRFFNRARLISSTALQPMAAYDGKPVRTVLPGKLIEDVCLRKTHGPQLTATATVRLS